MSVSFFKLPPTPLEVPSTSSIVTGFPRSHSNAQPSKVPLTALTIKPDFPGPKSYTPSCEVPLTIETDFPRSQPHEITPTSDIASGSSAATSHSQPREILWQSESFTSTETVFDIISSENLPDGWSILHSTMKEDLYLIYTTSLCDGTQRIIRVTSNLKIETRVNGNFITLTDVPETCHSLEDILTTMTAMQSLKRCAGPSPDQKCPIGLFQILFGRWKRRCDSCETKKQVDMLKRRKDGRKAISFKRNQEKLKQQNRELKEMRLEGFFGMVRTACGSSDHPDSLLFIQVYRLLSFYSLVKPPKGSNVEGTDIFDCLLTESDLLQENSNSRAIPEDYEFNFEFLSKNCHQTDDCVISHVCGYITKRIRSRKVCQECFDSLHDSSTENIQKPRNEMTRLLSNGGLIYASDKMFDLGKEIDGLLSQIISEKVEAFSIIHVMLAIEKLGITPVGCNAHSESFTSRVIQIFLCCRAKMLCKSYNKVNNKIRKQEVESRKRVKMIK
ncbi:hypothetical protein DMENIID0001_034350 [Sergentomyia squamirostris]